MSLCSVGLTVVEVPVSPCKMNLIDFSGMLAQTLPEVLHTATDCEEETFKAVPAAQVMCST